MTNPYKVEQVVDVTPTSGDEDEFLTFGVDGCVQVRRCVDALFSLFFLSLRCILPVLTCTYGKY